jgi:hypothetical protein
VVERFHRRAEGLVPSPLGRLGLVIPLHLVAAEMAEMVYGTLLTLSGDFVASPGPPSPGFLQELREQMSVFQPHLVRRSNTQDPAVVPELRPEATMVYQEGGEP